MQGAYFTFDKTLKIFAEGFNPVYRENGDFWRLHLDYGKAGYPRELGVYSHLQDTPETIKTEDGLRIIYDSVKAEDGSVHDIKLTLEVKNADGMLSFSATMENCSDVRLNELQYPFLDYVSLNGELKDDVLYLPNGLGRRIPDPHRYVGFCHTEYMGADYKNIKALFEYPAALSMPWLVMESGNRSLYMGCHSEVCRWATFTLYTEPLRTGIRTPVSGSHIPCPSPANSPVFGITKVTVPIPARLSRIQSPARYIPSLSEGSGARFTFTVFPSRTSDISRVLPSLFSIFEISSILFLCVMNFDDCTLSTNSFSSGSSNSRLPIK